MLWLFNLENGIGITHVPFQGAAPAVQFPRTYTAHYNPRGGYVAFLGRISPEKRPDRAIRIARTLGIPLKIAAKVDKVDEAYFQETIVPLLSDPGVEFIGEINERSKAEFLGEAQALLFPIHWPEPFGLVMIEAMACGFGQSLRAREGECELGTLAIGKRCQERISATGWPW